MNLSSQVFDNKARSPPTFLSDTSDNDSDLGSSTNSGGGCLGGGGIRLFGGGGGGTSTSTTTAKKPATTTTSTSTSTIIPIPTSTSTMMAEEMNHLSLQERDQAYEDLHGVSLLIHETPELITKSLSQMEDSIQSILQQHTTTTSTTTSSSTKLGIDAYKLACTINYEYVTNKTLRLMFLRAERFDSKLAAKRYLLWFYWKLQLFGQSKLCQWYITINDLDSDAKYMVEYGSVQVLPSRDSRGRIIVVVGINYHSRTFQSIKAVLQMFFYIHMSIVDTDDDVTNQKYGMLHIIYSLGTDEEQLFHETKMNDNELVHNVSNLVNSLPIRLDGMHYLTPPTAIGHAFALLAKTIGKYIRARLRIHCGSHMECEYALLTFGIPSSLLPFTTDSILKTANHKKWIQRQIGKENWIRTNNTTTNGNSHSHKFPGIELPSPNDVLLGKGKPIQDHKGNQKFHDLLQIYLEEYNLAHKNGGRTIVAHKILMNITTNGNGNGGGGRFLQACTKDANLKGWWEEVTNQDILIEKICNGLRNTRRSRRGGGGGRKNKGATTGTTPTPTPTQSQMIMDSSGKQTNSPFEEDDMALGVSLKRKLQR